jgi:predicted lipoprotein with Yx(FWY)xxD motif
MTKPTPQSGANSRIGMNQARHGYVTSSDLMEVHMFTSARITVAMGAAALALVTACSSSKSTTSAGAGGSTASGNSGAVMISSMAGTLVGPNGHTLYENTVDTATSISCTGACTEEWPPLTGNPSVGSGLNAADFETVTRPDGKTQIAFDGHPLYYFDEDKSAGDKKGEGFKDEGGSWHVASSSPVSTTGGTASVVPSMSPSDSSGGYGGGGY